MIQIKRAYESPARSDGHRVLVERLWPRGMKKGELAADTWMKEVAPSAALRKWFGHRAERWEEFQRRYRQELDANPDAWKPLVEDSRRGMLTLLYSARDTSHSGALTLCDYLNEHASAGRKRRRVAGRAAATGERPSRRRAR